MSLRHAILVLLESEGGTGYDLVKSFNQGLGYFWNASHQQVYQELKKLNAEQCLECHVQAQQGKPDKKCYVLTERGREQLQQWLAEPARLPRINEALLVKLYAGELNDAQLLREDIERQRQHYADMLETLLAMERQYQQQDDAQRQRWKLPYFTLKRGIYGLQAWLKWADELLLELEPPA